MEQNSAPLTPVSQPAAPSPARANHPIDWGYQVRQYGTAIAVAIPIYVVFSTYLFFRRGYYNLYIANKILAGTAVMLFGIILLIGPLSRWFKPIAKYIQYRKEFGIVGFLLAVAHGIASFFFLPEKFSPERFFTTGKWPFIFGLAATLVLAVIFFISNNWAMKKIGSQRWWRMQSWGIRGVFILIGLHVFVMKWKDWVNWYQKGGAAELVHPEWPGLGLLIGWFIAFTVLVRLSEFFGPRVGKAVWYTALILLPIVYFLTFWRGQNFV